VIGILENSIKRGLAPNKALDFTAQRSFWVDFCQHRLNTRVQSSPALPHGGKKTIRTMAVWPQPEGSRSGIAG
jgi:hypothetical protein